MLTTIVGVPRVKQFDRGWCGYATFSMILQFWGYNISQQDLYAHLDWTREKMDLPRFGVWPSIGELLHTVKELTPLRTQFITNKVYYRLASNSPYDYLKACLRGGYPCIIFHYDHFYVVVGFGETPERYFLKDSRSIGVRVVSRGLFDEMWKRQPLGFRYGHLDISNSFILIRP